MQRKIHQLRHLNALLGGPAMSIVHDADKMMKEAGKPILLLDLARLSPGKSWTLRVGCLQQFSEGSKHGGSLFTCTASSMR